MNTLVWFQHDLRIHDHPGLNYAIQQRKPIIAVYIYSPEEDAPWADGAASRWWLHNSLKKHAEQLETLNIKLHYFKADSVEKIHQLTQVNQIDTVIWTNRHEPHRKTLENKLEQKLSDAKIEVKRFKDELLSSPDLFLTASKQTPYRVFTPFYRKLRRELTLSTILPSSAIRDYKNSHSTVVLKDSLDLQQLQLLDTHSWHDKLHSHWSPGETEAQKKLDHFIIDLLIDYDKQRDFPATRGTSSLSPHLHFGEISPRQIVNTLAPQIEFEGGSIAQAAESFLRQLLWREFARYILWHFPETVNKPMNQKYKSSFWKNNDEQLAQWQQGKTGFTIIDAGMRELWQSGSMHNRVRMLTASLLTKNMGIDWQQGARWFWDTLVDADLANNTMGWQWVAGCGVDAAPYFRIFNPETQAVKFDKQQNYIKQWLRTTTPVLQPVIELSKSREDALYRYSKFIK